MLKISNDELLLRIQKFETIEGIENLMQASKSYNNLPANLAEVWYSNILGPGQNLPVTFRPQRNLHPLYLGKNAIFP